MNKLMIVALSVSALAGCTSQAQRMADCEAQGISRDACYIAEQNRQATINASAEKQAMENAQALYPVQKAQSAHGLPKGCTQVMDAAGQCNTKAPKVNNITKEADHVMNKPISDSAEYLLANGWKPNNGVWKKQGYTLLLTVENGKVVNSQLKK
ncbi:TPA: hypothetical protein ACJIWU_000048 [Enterobacter chengduensis]|uniref:hypothetical protein n=2 Tax=Enterobacter TaxID=547 RepID=UPI001E41729C|nr:hypothetical protein [Enterobacter chengduensis]MCK1098884.1 hypothetical protein [Enterobacter chengduensis]MCK6821123.1 hypothetical protein [Enterobacter chengduensis]MCK7171205.1 hypothetical protein [Enterobacter chengduensis]MCM7519541.1 hypothetical protein [Enterobacter chengduensis]MCM7676637.1 hypothetical protein [Enterobacter chengduensis]